MTTLQTVVEDVKGRVETITERSQKVAEISFDGFKQAGDIVVETVQTLINDGTAATKEILESAKTSYEKAKVDGFKAVVAAPVSYLPSREIVVKPFSSGVSTVSKSGDELFKVAKTSFSSIQAQITGAPVEKAAKAVKSTVKKATATAKKAASKSA